MFYPLIIFTVICSILLVLIILAQSPKGGIKNQLGSSSNVMGVKKTTDFLEKATWILVAIILTTSVAATKFSSAEKKTTVDPNIKAAQSSKKAAPKTGDKDFDLEKESKESTPSDSTTGY